MHDVKFFVLETVKTRKLEYMETRLVYWLGQI